jgi:hypothetical protein
LPISSGSFPYVNAGKKTLPDGPVPVYIFRLENVPVPVIKKSLQTITGKGSRRSFFSWKGKIGNYRRD